MAIHVPASIRAGGLAAVLGFGACAGSSSVVDDFDPPQIRVITPTEATSACVGKPTTPLCGIETLIGCTNYVWNEACALINSPVYPDVRRDDRIEYVIMKAGFVNREKVRATIQASVDKEFGDIPWLAEDLFQTKVLERSCPAARSSCEGVPWQAGIYSVGPLGRIPEIWIFIMGGIYDPAMDSIMWFVD